MKLLNFLVEVSSAVLKADDVWVLLDGYFKSAEKKAWILFDDHIEYILALMTEDCKQIFHIKALVNLYLRKTLLYN